MRMRMRIVSVSRHVERQSKIGKLVVRTMIRLVGASCTRMGAFCEFVELATGTLEGVEIQG